MSYSTGIQKANIMKQKRKYGLLFILIILVFMVSEVVASKTHMNYNLKFLNNRLSVNVEKMTLGSVLAKIQGKTGIKFLLDKDVDVNEIISDAISIGIYPEQNSLSYASA